MAEKLNSIASGACVTVRQKMRLYGDLFRN